MPDSGQAPLFQPNVTRAFLPAIKWEPDRIGDGVSNILDAKNVWPHPDGYQTIEGDGMIDGASGAPAAAVVTGLGVRALDGTDYSYICTATKLFRHFGDAAYTDLTGAVTAGPWSFCRYNDLVIATSTGGVAQKQTISGSSAFGNLGGSPPQMKYATVVRGFVVFARSTANPNRVQWSADGNPEDWATSAATQSGSYDIPDEGPVEAIIGGEYGLVFFANAIYRMEWVGGAPIFAFQKIASNIGVASQQGKAGVYNQVTKLGQNVYFVSNRGMSIVVGGQETRSLMMGRCYNYFFEQIDGTFSKQMQVAADPFRGMVAFAFGVPGVDGADTTSNLIFYHEALDRFSRAAITTECIFTAPIYNFEGTNVNIREGLTHYNTSHRHRALMAHPLASTFLTPVVDTEERQLFPGRRAIIRQASPNAEGQTSMTVAIGSRIIPSGAISRTSALAVNANGWSGFRKEGRYFSAQISYTAKEANNSGGRIIRGVEVEAVMQGVR